jgi:hypothetical protein
VAEGVHRPLSLTVLSFQQSSDSVPLLLVSIDAGWWRDDEDERILRTSVLSELKLDSSRVMLNLTHTHASCSLCRKDADKPGGHLIAAHMDRLGRLLIEAGREALQSAQPAVLTWATGRCNMATNRDLPDPQQPRTVCGFNPRIVADDTVLAGRITPANLISGPDTTNRARSAARLSSPKSSEGFRESATPTGKPLAGASGSAAGRYDTPCLATIVNYACHPTTLAWENRLLSPDYVGAMREVVEHHTGGAPCVFLQGASGELSPREYTGDTTIADENGRQLGYAAVAALETMLPPATALQYTGVVESGAPLATWARCPFAPSTQLKVRELAIDLPVREMPSAGQLERDLIACTDRTMAERIRRKLLIVQSMGGGPTWSQPAWIWRIGDSFLVGHPNEAYSEFQVAIRAAFPQHAIVVMNLVNGQSSYLSPPELYDQDIYQVWQSPFDRGALPLFAKTCHDAIARMIAEDDAA